MVKNAKDDQLVIPINILDGLAIRLVAQQEDIPYAQLVRVLLFQGLAQDHARREAFEKKRAEFAQLPAIELLNIKSNLTKPMIK